MVCWQLPLPNELKSTPSITLAGDHEEDQIGQCGIKETLRQIPQAKAMKEGQLEYFVSPRYGILKGQFWCIELWRQLPVKDCYE